MHTTVYITRGTTPAFSPVFAGELGASSFTPSQIAIGQTIYNVGRSRGASTHQMRAAMSAGWVESRFRNLDYGDRDSLGVFQQRPSQGWGTKAQIMDPVYAAGKFFAEAMRVSQAGTPGQLAQRVQRSGFPARYDEQMAKADEMLAIVSGSGSGSGSSTGIPSGGSSSDLTWYLVGGLLLVALI